MTTFDKEPAYVLHRRPVQELNSLVQFPVSFPAPDRGRVTTVVCRSSPVAEAARQERPAVYPGAAELLHLHAGNPAVVNAYFSDGDGA